MEQLTKNQAVATSQEAVQNQNEPQLRDENAHNDKSVRDEFVSVTEKLMDELAQCYNVLPQLDINNTIDHRPEGDEKWFLENEKTVTQFCRKLAAERPLKDI